MGTKAQSVQKSANRGLRFLKTTESAILLALIVISLILSILNPAFLTTYNIMTLFRQIAFITIVAYGQTLVLIAGGIDLSVGAMAALSSIISAYLMVNVGLNPVLCLILGLIAGALMGAINGTLIAILKINPFIATLACGEIFGGFIYVITQGWAIQGVPENILFLGRGMLLGIPVPVIIMLGLGLLLILMMKNTPFGRYIYAIGGNESAARLVGIRVPLVKITVFMSSGIMASLAGLLITCRLGSAQPTVGLSWLMPSVTAAILGGTSMSGGQGKIFGTIIGAALMGVISNAIVLLNVSPYWEKVITGLVVLVAVIIDRVRENLHKK